MASLVFSSTFLNLMNRTLDISSGTFYAHLVTTAPIQSNTTVANLTLAAGGNYALQTLTGSNIAADGTGARLTYTNPTWTGLTTNGAATIKGMVVCKQVGGSPATTDPIVTYVELSSAYTPNGADFTIQIPTTGVLKLS